MQVSLIGRRKYNLPFQAIDPECGVLRGGRIQVSFLTQKKSSRTLLPYCSRGCKHLNTHPQMPLLTDKPS